MRVFMLTLFACSIAACALDGTDQLEPVDNDQLASDEQTIINGVVDNGHPCVVGVFAHPPGVFSGSLCTGTVIAPRSILTAAHCACPPIIPPGQVIDILAGNPAGLTGIVATSVACDPLFNPANLFGGHDIAIVHTANPLPFPSCPRGGFNPNALLNIVGYGSNTHTNTGAGIKRQANVFTVAFNGIIFQDGNSNSQTCHGDSGGPAFQTIGGVQAVVGVTSFGQDIPPNVCFNGGFHNRVDAFAAFINANTF